MKISAIVLAAAMTLAIGAEAQALPVMPAPVQATDDDALTLVRQGCGFGAHRGPYGGCRLNRGPRGAIRGLVSGRPRRFCPPGTHRIGRSGVCRRNY